MVLTGGPGTGKTTTINAMLHFFDSEGILLCLIIHIQIMQHPRHIHFHIIVTGVPGTRLILVGDSNQLPSVGPGSVLKDIIASECFSVVMLTKIFRQAGVMIPISPLKIPMPLSMVIPYLVEISHSNW